MQGSSADLLLPSVLFKVTLAHPVEYEGLIEAKGEDQTNQFAFKSKTLSSTIHQ